MGEKKIKALNKYASQCRAIASVRVYESDKEVAESVENIKPAIKGHNRRQVCTFAVAKKY